MISPRDLPFLAVFAAVAKQGSFTRAARELGLSKSVVSEQVSALEERLGARLLERTTRKLRITELGTEVLGTAERVERELRELSARLDDDRRTPRGTLRIATTYDLGHLLVAPAAAALAARYPTLHFELVTDDAPRDLVEGRFDLAVRLGTPQDSTLVARRLLEVPEPIVAAPELAERWAHATRPRDLRGAPWVRHTLLGGPLTFRGPHNDTDELEPEVHAQASTGYAVRSLLLGGAGLGVLPSYMVSDDLEQGRLVRLCPAWIWRTVSLYALFPSGRHRRTSVELFVGELKARLGAERARWG